MAACNDALDGEPKQVTASLPIVPHHTPNLDAKSKAHLELIAARIRRQEPKLGDVRPFGDKVRTGLGPYPSLVIEDHSWIALFETAGDHLYGYRACTLAGNDDLVVMGVERCQAFEDYCRTTLGLGGFEIVSPDIRLRKGSLSVRCVQDPDIIARASARARRWGGFNLLPYMGTGGVWLLASRIAEAARLPVNVAAPPPHLTRRINDKLWFDRCVEEALGFHARPESFAAYGLAALVKEVSILARRNAGVAIKLPSSASSSGNVVLNANEIGGLSPREQRRRIDARLRTTGWRGGYPLLVTTWESPVLASPSVQLWIPLLDDGDSVIEGVFDQALAGQTSVFRGAAPTSLSRPLRQRLVDEAAALGYLFQRLGYFGRCSLDSIVIGETDAAADAHWVECNGRWGGTSIPMTLANRLIGDWSKASVLVGDRDDFSGPPWPFEDFCDEMSDLLFRRQGPPFGLVALSPSRIEAGTGYELLVFAPNPEDAQTRVERVAEAFRARSLSGIS